MEAETWSTENATKTDTSKVNEAGENEFILISNFEKYPVWFITNQDLTWDSRIDEVFVFKDGDVTTYCGHTTLTNEEMNELKDEEILQHASEGATSIVNGNYSLNIILYGYGHDTKEVELLVKDDSIVQKFWNNHTVNFK